MAALVSLKSRDWGNKAEVQPGGLWQNGLKVTLCQSNAEESQGSLRWVIGLSTARICSRGTSTPYIFYQQWHSRRFVPCINQWCCCWHVTVHPTLGTDSLRLSPMFAANKIESGCSAIHRKPCVFWMSTRHPLIGWYSVQLDFVPEQNRKPCSTYCASVSKGNRLLGPAWPKLFKSYRKLRLHFKAKLQLTLFRSVTASTPFEIIDLHKWSWLL